MDARQKGWAVTANIYLARHCRLCSSAAAGESSHIRVRAGYGSVCHLWTMLFGYAIIGSIMVDNAQASFDQGAEAWSQYNQRPLGRIRRAVTWHNLALHLPHVGHRGEGPRVLDAGAGSGELAFELAQRGYRVWLLDYAPAMLDQARKAARALPKEVSDRLTYCQSPVQGVSQQFGPGFFDVVACHTLIEYVPQPRDVLLELGHVLGDGGLLSVSFVNHHAGVLRQIWSRHDPAAALSALESGEFCASLFGLPGRAYRAKEVSAWLSEIGMSVRAGYGVRCFSDHVPTERLDDGEFVKALLQLERHASSHSPYKQIARYIQLIATKNAGVLPTEPTSKFPQPRLS